MLPAQTGDDTDRGWGDDDRRLHNADDADDARTRWLEENRPPHWDRG